MNIIAKIDEMSRKYPIVVGMGYAEALNIVHALT